MRTAFIQQLIREAEQNPRIFLIVGDLGYSVVEPFREKFPDRFLNAAIAEQNMVGVAAGLAQEGYNVYIYSIANFPTLRCIEQIRNDLAYYGANVKIVSVGAGYAYGSLGVSHHATEDLGIMRTLPGIVITSPSDPSEARQICSLSAQYEGTMYIRLGKAGETAVFTPDHTQIEMGRLHRYAEMDTENLILATGSILKDVVDFVTETGVRTAIWTIPFVKPIDGEQLCRLAQLHPNIITVEEHQRSCGMGSAVMESLGDSYAQGLLKKFPRIRRIAIQDKYEITSGTQKSIRLRAGLELKKEYFV